MGKWRSRLGVGSAIFGIWTAYGLLAIYQSLIFRRYYSEQPRPLGPLLRGTFATMWIWACFTPIIFWLSRRFQITRENWRTTVPLHVLFGIGFVTLDVALDYLLAPITGAPIRQRPFLASWIIQFDSDFFGYLTVASIAQAMDYQRRYRERRRRAVQLELQAAQLESRLGRAQLEVLRMQLQPHFLFNTMHAISELIHVNPHAADRMLTRLGDLLRMSLQYADRQEVLLDEEMTFVKSYLEIERCRHGDRLKVDMQVQPDTLEALVPHLILQPLVENAIRHGVNMRLDGCRIAIQTSRRNGVLEIGIEDDGPGLPAQLQEGVGLQNTRARLQALYGDEQALQLTNRIGGGTLVHLTLPYRVEDPDEDESTV